MNAQALVQTQQQGPVLVVSINNPPVNALGQGVRAGLLAAVEQLEQDAALKAMLIVGQGKAFIAGADIREFGKPPMAPALPDVLNRMETGSKLVVAAIHGPALGGGLEVAMATHFRVALAGAKLGLPEVNLGLLPGAGGTQRSPRLMGVKAATELMLSGQHLSAKAALAAGLVDKLAEGDDPLVAGLAYVNELLARGVPPRRTRDLAIADKAAALAELDAIALESVKKTRGLFSPAKIIECVRAAVELPFEQGLKRERELFLECLNSPQRQGLVHAFFAERETAKIPEAKAAAPRALASIAVIGGGTMGAGIAMNFLNVGIPVHIVETRQEALDRGLKTIRTNYENTAKKGRLTAQAIEERMALLSGSLDLQSLSDVDLVIEAVFENMDVKKDIFGRLDRICKAGAILASNTSALDLNEIASATSRPEAVIGLHFFSPANVMKLLEVVRGAKTSDSVIATSMQLAKKIGKVAVLVGVCPGFVGNRILGQRQREANALIMEGAMPWAVDRVLYDFGFPMGPFAMSDLAGLDLGWSKEKSSSSTLREVLCEMDRRGQKTGAGFYDYDEKRTAIPSPVVEEIIQRFAQKQGKQARQVSDQEILERCIYPMINEGAKILEEGMAIRASDIDVVWVNGYGWPVYRGGPMFYGDLVGLPKVLAKMKEFEASHGPQFKPAKLLEELAASGRKFSDLNPGK